MEVSIASKSIDHLVIRTLMPSDAHDMQKLILKNRTRLRQWLGWLDGDFSIDSVQETITRGQERTETEVGFETVIVFDHAVIGRLSFNEIDNKNKKASIGYWIDSNFEGRGLLTSAVALLCNYGFTALELNRLEIRCGAENLRSQKIANKLCFHKEGKASEAEWLYDHFVDHHIYALLSKSWGACQEKYL